MPQISQRPSAGERTLSITGTQRRDPVHAAARLSRFLDDRSASRDSGDLVRSLQHRVADVTGKEAALLLPTGTMAQQIALRAHSERRRSVEFAAHPTCHMLNYEFDGYAVVHGLRAHRLGEAHRLFDRTDLATMPSTVGSVVWELPQRELGGILPAWDELVSQVDAARAAGAATHLDGARLWEAAAGYDRTVAEISAPFDTVYVSLYKSLEAPRGAVIAGDRDVIRDVWTWAVRLGGDSAGNWPLAAFGLMALDELLPRMPYYLDHARAIADAIDATGVADVFPAVPETGILHVHLPFAAERVAAAHEIIARERGIQLFRAPRVTTVGSCFFEIAVGESALEIQPHEVADALVDLVELAASPSGDGR
ncbi:threonine aldolase family protein [Streptomyces sp. NPDC088816]|uniref:threonine aldolase family protein n=1 Tax=unclassified Streptomyces TaxID=2593676 RepID=UPI003800C6AC